MQQVASRASETTPEPLSIPEYTEVYGMGVTTIKLHLKTKRELEQFRDYKNQSYDELVQKLIQLTRDHIDEEGELNERTLKAVEQARREMRAGKHVTFEELKKKLRL